MFTFNEVTFNLILKPDIENVGPCAGLYNVFTLRLVYVGFCLIYLQSCANNFNIPYLSRDENLEKI